MNIVVGADHRGFACKEYIKQSMSSLNDAALKWIDVGTTSEQRTDYPLFARDACAKIRDGVAPYGVLICGSGIGMAVAANRYKRIYAGVVWSVESARLAREHDNVNVLVIPSDFISPDQAVECIAVWLSASFLGGRYATRIDMIDTL